MQPDLNGHTVIVTGANHGIGAATAALLAECGAAVLMTYLRIEAEPDSGLPETYRNNRAMDAHPLAASIASSGNQALAIEADLADPTTPASLFDMAETELGPVDILINNASSWIPDTFTQKETDGYDRTLSQVSADTFDQQFAVDARATALMIAEFSRRHTARDGRWGRIVSLTSGGPEGFPGEVSYGAAKAALENYTFSAAFELAHYGVTANVLHPPVTDTGWVTEVVRELVASRADLINIASPEDVARVIAYLVSDEARLITANRIHLR